MSHGWDDEDEAGGRAAALAVVSDVFRWHVTAERWGAVRQALGAMDAALAAGGQGALAAATAALEVAGPPRITRIGSEPVVPPPLPVRDLLNRLVHGLGGTTAPAGEPAWAAEAGDGDAAGR